MADPIKFYKGEETGIVHESYKEKETSLFKDQYDKALSEIGTFLNANSGKDNNIFAFLGDRGTGKTSCMESTAKMLQEISGRNIEEKQIELQALNAIKKSSFFDLDTIDPSTFDDDTNILQVLIGVLFEKFKDEVKRHKNEADDEKLEKFLDKKQKALVAFQNVKDCVKFISNPKLLTDDDDDISQLSNMASVSKLKTQIKKLVDAYLNFFDSNVLVLKIDDIDLQTKHAYQMVEQIRKYFIQPNVVILMAIKLEQLSRVIELENAKNYKELISLGRMSATDILDIAARYLLKLIPVNRRIYLITPELYLGEGLRIYTSREEERANQNTPDDKNSSLLGKWSSVKFAVLSLIYTKCRFLFYNVKGTVNPIVPRNLRELRHLLALLIDMYDYYDDNKSDDISYRKNNKHLFANYFYNTWVNNNINSEDFKIIDVIRSTKDAANINKVVLQLLHKKYEGNLFRTKDSDKNEEIADIFNEIFEVKNASYNISIADVQVVLNYIKQRISNGADKKLIFFIETYYSFKLYEYYDEMTEKYQSEAPKQSDEQIVDESIRRREVVDNVSNYEILVGGRFVNTDHISLTAKEKGNSKSRDLRRLNFQKLKKEAKKIIGGKDGTIPIQLIEFLALCMSRPLDSLGESVNKKYRTYNELYYRYIGEKRGYDAALFDLGAFFFNIVNIKEAYNRVDSKLWEKANSEGTESLYKKLIDVCTLQRSRHTADHAILSCASIRNYEVLSDFINFIQYGRLRRSPSASFLENLIAFFNVVALYNIETYDKHVNKLYDANWKDQDLELDKLEGASLEETDVNQVNVENITKEDILIDNINLENNKKRCQKIPSVISFKYANEISNILKDFTDTMIDEMFLPDEVHKGNPSKVQKPVKVNKNNNKFDLNHFDIEVILKSLSKVDIVKMVTLQNRGTSAIRKIQGRDSDIEAKWKALNVFVDCIGLDINKFVARIILTAFKVRNNLK